MRKLVLSVASVMIFAAPAMSADLPVKASPYVPVVVNWTGFYLGGHVGYGWTTQKMSAADNAALNATYGAVPSPSGFVGGLHAGYDYQFANRVVLGVGVEVNGFGVDAFHDTVGLAPASSLKSNVDWDIAVLGKLGYGFDRFMPYVVGGAAWDHNRVRGFNGFIGPFSVDNWHHGWTIGGGVEAKIFDHWTGRIQYRYVDGSTETYINRQISGTASLVDVGVSYRF